MKFDKPNAGRSIGGQLQFGVTNETYVEKTASFLAGKQAPVVIRALEGTHGSLASKQPATEAPWLAWMAYFEGKGIFARRINDRGASETVYAPAAKQRGMTTVPCEWPEEFDGEWTETSDRYARLPRFHQSPEENADMRRRIAASFRKLGVSIASIPDEKKARASQPYVLPDKSVPVGASDDLRVDNMRRAQAEKNLPF